MFRFRSSFVYVLGGICMYTAPTFCAQQPLTSLQAVHAISNAEAARSIPVAFEGTVTYYEKRNVDLFVQDGDAAIYVETSPDLELETGDRVRVEGKTRASFRPEIEAKRVTFLHHGAPPPPVEAHFYQLIRAELDCRRATVRGIVRTADLFSDGASKSLLLDVVMPGGHLQAQVANSPASADLHSLLDSTVVITGAVAGRFDSKSQMTGVLLEVPSYSDLRVLQRPQVEPNQLPLRPFDEILRAVNIEDQTDRVRVEGTITYYQPGAAMVLQDGSQALWVDTLSEAPHRINDYAVVTGFPAVRNGSVILTQGEVERSWPNQDLKPVDVDAAKLASGIHAFELVSIEGRLVTQVRAAAQDEYVIASEDRVFTAIFRHPERGLDLPVPPMRNLQPGSRVRVVGICVLDRGDQFRGPVAFHVLLRSPEEVVLLAGPSLISVRNLGILLGLLLILVFIAIGRSLLLERRLRRQDQARASSVERWRNRVIDGIQNAIPLQETLLQITELLAFKLQADYCWVETEFEGTFGNYPTEPANQGLRIVGQPILARSGAALGKICAGFKPGGAKHRLGADALDNATGLAALAIETGGKYSDLVRRSELDPLTNARNRFAFNNAVDLAIAAKAGSGGRLGLIYIDLDGFKQINDRYGHHIGDLHLQETVSRLSHQLRSNDALARLGGDEFAVLVADVKSAEEVVEITSRLQKCLEGPFHLDTLEVPASASIGFALYPEDAVTREKLLELADIRMYMAKRRKRPEHSEAAL